MASLSTTTETDILTVTTTTASPGFTSSIGNGGTETITTNPPPGTRPPNSSSFTTLTSALSSGVTSSISISGPPNTNSTEILTSTTTANGTSTSDGAIITSPVITPKPPSSGNSFSGGAVAGVVIGAIAIVALVILGIFLIQRRKRRYISQKEEGSNSPPSLPMGNIESRRQNRDPNAANTNPSPAAPLPVVQFDPPLDDVGLTKLFNQLDDRISDHLVNFNIQENLQLSGSANYPAVQGPKAHGEGILFRGKTLLERQDSRLFMLRALFAYHVFGSIADQLIFSKEQRLWIRQAARGDRPTRRAAVCRQLEAKDTFAAAVDFLYSHLERETQIYVPPNNIKSENRQASLMAIARSAALVILRLGLQRDHFKLGFLFQSGNYAQVEGVIPYETSAIREFKANPEDYQIFGEARHDSVVSATISPSVYRRTDGEHRYRVRRMKIFMAPRNLRQ
ncbi:hypothetical protein EYR41_006899 [Orbilia oligospora]|uniref:Uncharacterized protein n=1 Tax=Orbilia oligospora TaxID=2813651 RepID=A0A8H2DWX5_ORBOL|nr:hypothetical protein EYR41_006899 [Orbilia oligospora]